jgi:hypothetical protein
VAEGADEGGRVDEKNAGVDLEMAGEEVDLFGLEPAPPGDAR